MMSLSKQKADFGGRQYFLDWLRVLAFAYLVLFHTGMMFVDWGFHIESGHNSEFLKSIMMLTTTWRLDLLFLVSGVAISFMVTKMSINAFLGQRIIKLLIPLLFACAVVIAPQPYFEAIQKGLIDINYFDFWPSMYFDFTWLDGMMTPWPTYNHMWYVLYLFMYTILLIPLFLYINSDVGKKYLLALEEWLTKGARILWAPLSIYILAYLYTGHNNITHAVWDDWFGHFIYAYILILGIIFVRMPRCWQAFENIRLISLILAFASYGILLIKYNLHTPLDTIPWDLVEMIIKWSWVATLIGYARKYLNFTNPPLKYLNGIVYPFFILHQSVTIIIGYHIIQWGLHWVIEFTLIAIGTYAVSILLIEIIIKRINVLRLVFGLKLIKKEPDFALKPGSSS